MLGQWQSAAAIVFFCAPCAVLQVVADLLITFFAKNKKTGTILFLFKNKDLNLRILLGQGWVSTGCAWCCMSAGIPLHAVTFVILGLWVLACGSN